MVIYHVISRLLFFFFITIFGLGTQITPLRLSLLLFDTINCLRFLSDFLHDISNINTIFDYML